MFKSLMDGISDLKANVANLPSVYPKGTMRHAEVDMVVLQCEKEEPSWRLCSRNASYGHDQTNALHHGCRARSCSGRHWVSQTDLAMDYS